jgi:hypothetical protein
MHVISIDADSDPNHLARIHVLQINLVVTVSSLAIGSHMLRFVG